MGLLKFLARLFKCESKCMFNIEEMSEKIKDIDIDAFDLKPKDIIAVHKILNKRPSKIKPRLNHKINYKVKGTSYI